MRTNLTDIQWCPGCWNFLILSAVKSVFKEIDIPQEKIVTVSWIWCSWKITQYLPWYAAETLHWRSIPFWIWVKFANKELKVICFWWDGDMYWIWLSHLLHAARKNIDITVIVHNNENYWLTTGQASPTTPKDVKTSSTPYWNPFSPFNPNVLLEAAWAKFTKTVLDKDLQELKKTIKDAILFEGFAHVDVKQSCPSWEKR
jgi:2-oxoglutarate ferredoxin oxidoreductase subunit beta